MTDNTFKPRTFVLKEDGKIYYVPDVPELIQTNAFSNDYREKAFNEMQQRKYNDALQSAISKGIEVENQEEVLDQLWRNDERINNPIPFLFWKENMLPHPKGNIYTLECSVEKKPLCGILGCLGCPTVALVTFTENKDEEEDQDDLWDAFGNEVNRWEHPEDGIGFHSLTNHLKKNWILTRRK
jgi:hypothetical protein